MGVRALNAPPLHGRRDVQGVAVFCHRPPGDIDTVGPQNFNDSIVGEDILSRLGLDQFFNLMTYRFGGMGLTGFGRADGRGKEIFEFE